MYPVKDYQTTSTNFADPILGSFFGRHLGLDFPVGVGTEVYAPVSGRIRAVQNTPDVGLLIELAGDDGYYHRFLHLSRQDVFLNQRVEKGQLIALSGDSGSMSDGAHLHWDIRKPSIWNESFENYIDPKEYVKGDDMIDTDDKAVDLLVAVLHETAESISKEAIASIKWQPYATVIPVLINYSKWRDQNDKLVAYDSLLKSKTSLTPEQLKAIKSLKEVF